jgi:transcriptional regulator with PAS, ATPase and Fis domain
MRRDRPFVALNCGGVPETLLESELFGHVRGAFTGADANKKGLIEVAEGGTVFLDEIGEMTTTMQVKLLRVLQDRRFRRLGGTEEVQADIRIIAATNQDLQKMVADNRFREDLFYRINVIHLVVPPLRSRREDIPMLVEHFLARFTAVGRANGNGAGTPEGFATRMPPGNGNRPVGEPRTITVPPDVMEVLTEYAWPGNVRELENVVERLVVTGKSDTIRLADLPLELRAQPGAPPRAIRERRRTIADELYRRVAREGESFWTAVYPLYMQREITKNNVRDVVRRGLEEARGNYKIVARLFNLGNEDYKRFLNFLRKHECHLPFRQYRQ